MNKFTFKTVRPTGSRLSRIGEVNYNKILLNKKECGSIEEGKTYSIRFMVTKADVNEDGNPNCTWKWVQLKKESATLDEAKAFLEENIDYITEKLKIRTME